MSQVMESQPGIYTGFWTNWSRGPVLGATLTLTRFHANILIAFTSFFLGIVGTRMWRIVCFILHRYFSRPSGDGLHHQRQLVLRNSQSAEHGLVNLLWLYLAWKRVSTQNLSRLSGPTVIAAICFCTFGAISGLSATITSSAGQAVLLESTYCSILGNNFTTEEVMLIITPHQSIQANEVNNYAQQCYYPDSSSVFDCTTFVTPQITSSVNNEAGCPFDNHDVCKSQTTNIVIESNGIDSNTHLGLNYPENERIQLNRRLHCAPLKTEGYTTSWEFDNKNWTRYHYGSRRSGTQSNVTVHNHNLTYQVPSIDAQYANLPQPSLLAGRFSVR